jgi:hypothetical protein
VQVSALQRALGRHSPIVAVLHALQASKKFVQCGVLW